MSRRLIIGLLLVIAAIVPATAFAHRPATRGERLAILQGAVRAKAIDVAQAQCVTVTVSTADARYAAFRFPAHLSRRCQRVAADGVTVMHEVRGSWRFLTAGSSFTCPIRGVPAAVARDFALCPA